MDQLKASCKIQAGAAAADTMVPVAAAHDEELNFLLSSYGFISVLIMLSL